ncbi:hypothetical protein NGM10_04055 [Halorussus salilacus]|uniref:DUF7286 family protein n=1 Tax=Halorussus salilacus TaxID=2953750 RepID=UPI00209D6C6B|nr:hypothetical protein [Halorussus salilacus]USZ68914.1 hypothetical protein NGM10_04055 [Halorussus salilacus]
MVVVRLADDRRGRVPFALVGVVLLVGSAAIGATLAGDSTPRTDRSVGTAMDRTTAATNTALRGAVADAGRAAAREPVTASANTTAGVVLNDSTPYRDYLRIRIYLEARSALDGVGVREGDVRGSVSLPAVSNASELRDAKRRVRIAPAGESENRGLRVRIENVTVTATRGGEAVERETVSPSLVVATPALALHERTERFESRLNRGPLDPGLGRRLTARLYAVAWARGYAQRGGAPIQNVVANRHVELAANGALLGEQRTAFGRNDPAGRRAAAWATARVGATDLLTGIDDQRGTRRTESLLAAADRYREENPMPGSVADPEASHRDARTVGVNRTADRAFEAFVAGENEARANPEFDETLRSAYEVETRLVASVREVDAEPRPSLDPPGENWTLADRRVETTTKVERDASAPPPETPPGWHLLDSETRRVVRTKTLVADWTRGNETRTTTQRWTEASVARVGIAGDHRVGDGDPAPTRPVAGVHERGGPLGGPNLRDVSARATERLVADSGGFDAAARRAVEGNLDTRTRRVSGRRPADLRRWAYLDLVDLRERVRNVSVEASPTAAVADEEPPAAALARELRTRRAELLGVPERYDGAADRVRVAARAAYLDRVLARLDARADRTTETRRGLDGALGDAGVSLDRARRILRERTTPATPPPRPVPADGPGAAANLSVSGAPPYLTLAELDREQVSAIPENETRYPLEARNLNVFTVPYGDAADAVASAFDRETDTDGGGTDLRTSGLALRAANRTLDARESDALTERRNALRSELSASLETVAEDLVAQLAMPRHDLTVRERERAVRDGLSRWNTTAGRALAVSNGSAADAIRDELLDRRPELRRADRRDWVETRTETALEDARRDAAGPDRSAVNRTASKARELARDAAKDAVKSGIENATERAKERWFGEVLASVPAGLPVAPVPGHWYATVNVWDVSVAGQYERFAVGAPAGTPDASGVGESTGPEGSASVGGSARRPADAVTYVREEGSVDLDVDGDGDPEELGRTDRVSFESETVVVVVVPPGPPGVGDTDGNGDERSPGWDK